MVHIQLTHRRINDVLTVIVVLFGLYLMAAPFIPQVLWKLNPPSLPEPQSQSATTAKHADKPVPSENLLIIPRLGMSETIHDGPSQSELNKGVWLVPNTSQPDKASNTVIIGHRFTYAGPAVFYLLDKVQVGDQLIVDWHSKEYTYKVTTIREVEPSELSVQDPSSNPELTLYTCTPLWTSKHRLVLVAPLQGVRS
jgi:LPXTG-site transpeptidase (sortase) family protein